MRKKSFWKRGRTALLVLALIIIGNVYYFLVHRPVEDTMTETERRVEAAMTEVQIESAKIQKKQQMQEEIKKAQEEDMPQLPEYDNSTQVVAYLNNVMAATWNYNLIFGQVSFGDYVVARPITMTFICSNYSAVKNIITQLEEGPYLCEVTAFSMSTEGITGNITRESVTTQLTAVFYEYTATSTVTDAEAETEVETGDDAT